MFNVTQDCKRSQLALFKRSEKHKHFILLLCHNTSLFYLFNPILDPTVHVYN